MIQLHYAGTVQNYEAIIHRYTKKYDFSGLLIYEHLVTNDVCVNGYLAAAIIYKKYPRSYKKPGILIHSLITKLLSKSYLIHLKKQMGVVHSLIVYTIHT